MTDNWHDNSPFAQYEQTTKNALHDWLLQHNIVSVTKVVEARNPVYLCTVSQSQKGLNDSFQYLKCVSGTELQMLQWMESIKNSKASLFYSKLVSQLSTSDQHWVLLEEVSVSRTVSLTRQDDIDILTKSLVQFHQGGFDTIPIQHDLPHLLGGLLNPPEVEVLCTKYFMHGGQQIYGVIADSIDSDMQAPHVLLHGDLTPANVFLCESEHPKSMTAGFIDFEYVSIGNPLWDLGMLVVELTEIGGEVSGLALLNHFDALVASYRQSGGVISSEQRETAWVWIVCYWLVAKEWAEKHDQPTLIYQRLTPAINEIVRKQST